MSNACVTLEANLEERRTEERRRDYGDVVLIRILNIYLPLSSIAAVEVTAQGCAVHLHPDCAEMLGRKLIVVPHDDTTDLLTHLEIASEPPLLLSRSDIEDDMAPIEPVPYDPPKKATPRKPRGKRASD